MATYDLSLQLKHRTGKEFTTMSVGLDVLGIWNEPADYQKPIQIGTLFELVLLYTIDRRTQQKPAPNNVLSEEDKRSRHKLSLKVADNNVAELDAREVELLKLAITVFGTEVNALCHDFLENPKI